MVGGLDSPSTTVLSTPTSQGPPSNIKSIRPERSCRTCEAVVGEGLVEALAEGAASGRAASWTRLKASKDEGMRTATVEREAVTSGANGDGEGSGRRMVSGPGQNRDIR